MCDEFTLQDLDPMIQELCEKRLAILSEVARPFGLAVISPEEVSFGASIEYTLGFEGVPCFKVTGPAHPMSEAELRQHFANRIQNNLGSCFLKGA